MYGRALCASPGTDRAPTWTLALEAGASATCRVTGPGVAPAPTACSTSHTADLSAGGEGTYVLTVVATDDAGNTTTETGAGYVLLLPPATPSVSGPATPGNDSAVLWTFAVPAGASASCSRSPASPSRR